MLKTQIDQYDMLLSVEGHFDENSTLWTDNEPITAAKTMLSGKIDGIAREVAIQLVNPTGITVDKAYLRSVVENKGFILSAAVSAYAASTPGKTDLYNKVHYTKTDFSRFREAELIGVITNLHRDATSELTNLAPFGVTNATLSSLMAANDAFGAIMKNPTQAIAKRKSATNRIGVLLPEAIEMLETQMDNLIVAFSAIQPQFSDIYWNVRAIHNSGSGHLSLTITTLDARNNDPIANADLVIVGEGITRVSSERGYNTVKNLPEGNHQLTVSHPNFATQTISFTTVSGETTELVITMENVMANVVE